MQFNYFDIHSHLNLEPLLGRADEVVQKMKDENMGTISVGVDLATSKQNVYFAEKYDNVWACVGQHPADNHSEDFDMDAYRELARHKKVVAIGECGLDFFRDESVETKARQEKLFRQQIKLALETGKPLMIHSRPSKGSMNAYEHAMNVLQEYQGVRANFHFFVGDLAIAKRALEMGFTMSFDGPITFSRDYDEVIKFLPLENIMAETDAPYAAPTPWRGQTCEPYMVSEIVKKIAEIKNLPLETVQKTLLENVKRVFDIKV